MPILYDFIIYGPNLKVLYISFTCMISYFNEKVHIDLRFMIEMDYQDDL